MKLSGTLVLFFLKDHTIKNCHFDTAKSYQTFSIPADHSGKMSPDIVYICLLSTAVELQSSEKKGCNYICIQDRVLSESELSQLNNMILIQEAISLGDLYTLLTDWYCVLNSWYDSSVQALLNGCNYQRILDLAENIIGEPVYIMDSTFKLLANFRNCSSPDPINVSLEKFGYHTDETIEILKQNQRLKLYSQEQGFIINKPGFTKFPTITKCFNRGNKTDLIITLVCVNEEYSEYILELFKILTSLLHICFTKHSRELSFRISPQDTMLYKLIYEDNDVPFTVAERARSSSFPITGRFVLFRIMYDSAPTLLIDKTVEKIRRLFPKEHVFSHNHEITMVCVLHEKDPSYIQDIITRLETPMAENGMICGISPIFYSLHEIRTASENATTALSFGKKFIRHGNFSKLPEQVWLHFSRTVSEHIYSYDNLFDFIIFSSFLVSHEVLANSSIHVVRDIAAYDDKHNSCFLSILMCYLMYGNRATDAGAALHMHRNNIVYNIKRISELFHLDLENKTTCDKLWNAFKLLTVAHADKSETRSGLI